MPPASAAAELRDRDITELLRTGAHERGFECLIQRYETKVYRLCCAIVRDPTHAQDVAQEAWLRIWRALPLYDGRAAWSTWIYAITRNRCLSALEQRREHASLSEPHIAAQVEQLAGPAEVAEDAAATLRHLVETLPERQQRVLRLFYYEDCSVPEVAAMLGMPQGTVKTLLFRARAALAQELHQRGLDNPAIWAEHRYE